MQDPPAPAEILAAVADFLRERVVAETSGHTAFQARVAANAVDLVRRQLELAPSQETAERERLMELLGRDEDLDSLNRRLCADIDAGVPTPGLIDHLWATTLEKLAVDQPGYAGYRRALEERGGADGGG